MNCSLKTIIEEQHYLNKFVNIPISDSEHMFDHERMSHVSILIKDKKEELKQLESLKGSK